MGGDIHLSGGAERINGLARAHGLQAVAESSSPLGRNQSIAQRRHGA
jgi:hypothetical protein